MADTTEDQKVSDDTTAEDGGSLAAALLSAGFGADGEMPEAEAEVDAEAEVEAEAPEAAESADEAVASEEVDVEAADVPVESAPDDGGAQDSEEAPEEEEDDDEDEAEGEEEEPISPYDLPGGWYVIHSYSGYENKVKANLATRTSSMHMEDRIFEVVIPMESVVEIKGGRKVEVEKKMFPGYILVRMYLDDDSWYAVRNTPGVTAFVGGGSKPTPLSRREVERFLGVKKEEEKRPPKFTPAWDVGEVVRVVNGPFADFNGVIEDINVDQQKVRVLVEIFGRDTPMELNFEEIQKQ